VELRRLRDDFDIGTHARALAALRVMPDVQGVDDQPAPVEAAEVEILVERLRPHHHGRDVASNIDDVNVLPMLVLRARSPRYR
jgi:hypothetical protein